MNQEEYQFRRLKASDKEDIMEIASLTWNGHDHLPQMFETWIDNPQCYPYGIEVYNRIISLGNVKIIENGQTAWLEGLRVHPDYRGKGYARVITQLLYEESRKMGAERTRLTLATQNPVPAALAKTIGMRPLFSLNVSWKAVDALNSLSADISHIKKASGSEIHKATKLNKSLLPSDIFVYHWYALDATEDNLVSMEDRIGYWILQEEGYVTGLAIGFQRQDTENILEWCTTLYSQTEKGFHTLVAHQVQEAKKCNSTSMMFLYSEEYESSLLSLIGEKIHELTMMLFEGSI